MSLRAVCLGLLAGLLIGCASQHATSQTHLAVSASQAAQAAPSAAPASPPDSCVAAVDQLLSEDLSAIEQGYNGIDISQVMAQYGASSPVYETFSQLGAQLAMDAYQYGAGSALAPVERQVPPMCRQYGA